MKFKDLKILSLQVIILLLFACEPSKIDNFHPMVDGQNTEYDKLRIEPIMVTEDVNLYVFQNDSYVWISYDYPPGSYGTLDMLIETNTLSSPLNLHVSVQLGEWIVGKEEETKPATPTSDLWWNNKGWTANNLWANGIDTTSYDTPEFKIKNGDIRELQLSKERFGRGEWKIRMKINGIKNGEGQFYSTNFPETEAYHKIMVK